MNLEAPEYNTSIQVAVEDVDKLRSLVGKNDAHRIRIALQGIQNYHEESLESDIDKKTIQLNKDDKEIINEIPGQYFVGKFHNFIVSIENENDIKLLDENNVMIV